MKIIVTDQPEIKEKCIFYDGKYDEYDLCTIGYCKECCYDNISHTCRKLVVDANNMKTGNKNVQNTE
jgi:hypothetical protein